MLIRNYGLYWRRESVYWGRQGGKAGHLKGVLASAKKASFVDFRYQKGVYTLYDDNFNLVYAGQSGAKKQRLLKRLKDHRTDQLADRWSRFSWFGIRWVTKKFELSADTKATHPQLSDVLNHIEAILISSSEPPHNRQGGRFGDKVEQYLQYNDKENLGLNLQEMIREIHVRLPKAATKS